MTECKHQWEMTDVQMGYIAFEKCFHCDGIRTYFSTEDSFLLGDKYREGPHFWSRVDNAQSFQFNLTCAKCKEIENYDNLMGLMYCTGCLQDCDIEILQKKYNKDRAMVLVAFGFFPESKLNPITPFKIDLLTDYFNQRRDTSRSKIKILPFDLIKDLSLCRGDFLHDMGMLSQEPPGERQPVFWQEKKLNNIT